ncbi:mediator of RNA polymerase II transcription subunit 10 [Lepidopterella palustris CBS 459.81]|uniref:Mediator of RNA polymerase II transcription subunit 10 n=1 Tax=Lepidopterella palustris CBS 459.81 TaxID=1314670 RepID=A0A8E2JH83_9PEZI|nr:mediator of RNA polymerase II transcription subunit 10 [Lepidopterella palustris CBS 459.81]
MVPTTLIQIDEQLKAIVQNLYNLIVQSLDHQGSLTEDAMKREIQNLIQNLVVLTRSAPSLPLKIPPDVIQYVEQSRNPDIYTREFVELAQRENQKLKGKSEAFAQLRDILAKEIVTAIPEVRGDVKKVVESTGGRIDGLNST